MILFFLCMEFAKIGFFSLGGGYATLPFLYHMSEVYGWFSPLELSRMLAISSITPGPVGLNVATFAGFKTAGILGSIVATMSIMLPSFFMIIIISKMLKKFKDSPCMCSVMFALRPATAAMLAAVALRLFRDAIIRNPDFSGFNFLQMQNFIDIKGFLLLVILFILSLRLKKDPLVFLAFGAIAGILLHINHIIL
mgnify:FL=1